MADPLYNQGIVKDWHIEELDLIHKERDDELTITGKFWSNIIDWLFTVKLI